MSVFVYRPPTTPWLDIVYRDDALVVLNKPSGLLSVPGRDAAHKDSLTTRLQRVLPTATVVHRLDMDTSGLMLFALTREAQSAIGRQFQQRQTHKTYLARIYGQPTTDSGSVELPLICDWPNRPRQKVCFEQGKASLTHWRLLRQDPRDALVELTPITGRSHQLRVHMQQLGHPILGDRFYAHDEALAGADRLHLHAHKLQIHHPLTGDPIEFVAPSPF